MQRREIARAEFPQFVIRECVYAPGLRLGRHAHDYSNVTIVASGIIEEAAEAGEYRACASSVVLKPAETEHENRVGGRGARTITIELRGSAAAHTWAWLEEPAIVRAAVALQRAMRSGIDVEACAADLVALVTTSRRAEKARPPWLADAIELLDQRFDAPLRFDAIARELGLHPVYLSRAFHRHQGVSMQEYVRALRLRHARRLLAGSHRSVAAIAAESGFHDASHLCRAFRQTLAVTPGVYRSVTGEVQHVQRGA